MTCVSTCRCVSSVTWQLRNTQCSLFGYTSRDIPPSVNFHCYGAPLTTSHEGIVMMHFDSNNSGGYHYAGTMHASSHWF